MNKLFNIIAFLMLLLFSTSCNTLRKDSSNEKSENQYFQTEAAEMFLKLGEKMLSGKEPSKDEWNTFFNNEGMQIIFENELITQINKEIYQQYFRMSFLPSMKDSLTILTEEGSHTIFHFIEIKNNFVSYQKILNEPQKFIDYNKALKMVKEYLPSHFYQKTSEPKLYLVFYNPYNQGLKKGLLIDVEQLRKNIENEKSTPTYGISHEMHHYFTINNSEFDPIETIVSLMQSNSSDFMPMWFVLNAHYEGFAQQIDIPTNDYENGFLEMVEEVPSNITALDEMMSSIYTKKEDVYGMEKWAEKLPDSAHPFGYYMYQEIIKECPKEKLLESVTNPFQFFELYHQYVKGDHLNFSDKTMSYIGELENKYF